MNNTMSYKGDLARIEFNARDNIFVGHVLGIADRISFHGEAVGELTTEFHQAIEHYLEDCAKTGRAPEKSTSAS